MSHLILCSQSPRRKQILTDFRIQFETQTPNVDESELLKELPLHYLRRISESKIESIRGSQKTESWSFLSSDTIVVFQNQILHKPLSIEESFNILSKLSGKSHFVYSSYCFVNESHNIYFDYDTTEVHFANWNTEQILRYIQQYQPFDKAGSYGIQDKNSPVEKFIGSYTNVLGFPIRKFLKEIHLWKQFMVY